MFDEEAVEKKQEERGTQYITQKCFNCDTPEQERVLLPCRKDGESLWVCVRCLPPLIHG